MSNVTQKPKPAASMKVDKDGKIAAHLSGLEELFGSKNEAFLVGMANQLINITSKGQKPDNEALAFAGSLIAGIKPRDEIEAMLAVQMAGIHNATVALARRLAHCETIPQQDSASRSLNQLARTYVTQVEALKRHRTGGQQRVIVEHVTVEAGGQAVVGTVETGGRGR